MRNRLSLMMLLGVIAVSVYGERFRIMRLNTSSITIDKHVRHQGDTIDRPQTIDWVNDEQAIQLQDLSTGNIFFFSAKSNSGQKNLWNRMYSEEKGSTRQIRTRRFTPEVKFGSVDVKLRNTTLRGDSLEIKLNLEPTENINLTLTGADSTRNCVLDSRGKQYGLKNVVIRSDAFDGIYLQLIKDKPVVLTLIIAPFNSGAETITQMALPFTSGRTRTPLVMRKIPVDFTTSDGLTSPNPGRALR